MTGTDRVYHQPLERIEAFVFDQQVATVFDDMIERSVPGYRTIISMTGVIAQEYAQAGSNIYDMGCSLGATSLAIKEQITTPGCRIFGVDNSKDMLARCQHHVALSKGETPIELIESDIQSVKLENASVVVFNFTLQFIPVNDRAALLRKVYDALKPGGVLVLSEKIRFNDAHLNEINTTLHHDFKRRQGYSELEIAQKRTALENVLIPETLSCHKSRLKSVGFDTFDVWFQCFNFMSMLAVKSA